MAIKREKIVKNYEQFENIVQSIEKSKESFDLNKINVQNLNLKLTKNPHKKFWWQDNHKSVHKETHMSHGVNVKNKRIDQGHCWLRDSDCNFVVWSTCRVHPTI